MAEVTQVTGVPFKEALTKDGNGVPIGWRYHNVTGQATVEIKAGAGTLHAITFNKPVATSVLTIYDNTAGSGTAVIGTVTVPASPQPVTLFYDCIFTTGLTVVMATADMDITVSYI